VRHLKKHEPYLRALGFEEIHEVTGPLAARHTDSILTDHWRRAGCLRTFRKDYAKRAKAGPYDATWPSPLPEGETLDDFVGGLALDFLDRQEASRAFATFVGFGGPHWPWDPPPEWADRYDPSAMDEPLPPVEPGAWVPEPAASFQRHLQGGDPPTREQMGRIRALYYAKISHIDAWIGRILERLERSGLAESTAVLLWSDHGEMLGDKARLGKNVAYEGAVRVPLLLRLPGADASPTGATGVRSHLVSILDAYPTILDIAGCASDEWRGFGRSLVPLVREPSASHHDAVFGEIGGDEGFAEISGRKGFRHRTVICGPRFKMVVSDRLEVLKLHDLREDPRESVNLAGRPDFGPVVEELKERLRRWRVETSTPPRS
jgi:choline-sulfatase